jgi:hypothetical protein
MVHYITVPWPEPKLASYRETTDLGVVKATIFHIGGGEGMAFGGSSAVSLRGVNGFH